MCLQRPRNEIYLITTIQVNTLQLFTGVERPSQKFLRPKLTSVNLKKRPFFRLSKPIIGASFFKKWQILHFPAIKTDWWGEGSSNQYQSLPPVIRKSKHMHMLGIRGLDPARCASEIFCTVSIWKKIFLRIFYILCSGRLEIWSRSPKQIFTGGPSLQFCYNP